MKFVHYLAGGGLLAAISCGAAYAEDWKPSQPISMIVGFAAGGPADVVSRDIALRMGEHLGQNVIVENVGGAGGILAARRTAAAAADGHTIFFAAAGNVVQRPLVGGDEDIIDRLDPVSLVSRSPHILVVSAKTQFETMADLIQHARENPGEINFASAGAGAAAHLGMEMLKLHAEIDIEHIPYPGTAPSLVDLAAGAVDATLTSMPSLEALLTADSIRILGATDEGPNNRGAPLISETVPGYGYSTWYAVFAPRGTDGNVVASLNAAIRHAVADEELQERLAQQNLSLEASTPEELGMYWEQDVKRWREVLEAGYITLN